MVQKVPKNTFFEWSFNQKFKTSKLPDIQLMYINIITTKKTSQNFTHNLNFQVYIQNFKLCDKYIPYIQVFQYMNNLNMNLIKYT
jgi:hypothetical protein